MPGKWINADLGAVSLLREPPTQVSCSFMAPIALWITYKHDQMPCLTWMLEEGRKGRGRIRKGWKPTQANMLFCLLCVLQLNSWTQDLNSLWPCYVILVVSYDSLWPYGLWPARLLCPWDSPGKNTGESGHDLLQGIFPTQGSNPSLL